MELNLATSALLRRVNHATVERPRVHVQTDRTLVKFTGIHYAVYGIGRVHSTGMGDVHFHRVQRRKLAMAICKILMDEMEVFYLQAADGNGHPAVLVTMVVYGTGLSNFPADGHEFVERSAVDEVARVVLAVPIQVRSERLRVDRHFLEKFAERLGGKESGIRKRTQLLDEFLNRNGFDRGDHRHSGDRV